MTYVVEAYVFCDACNKEQHSLLHRGAYTGTVTGALKKGWIRKGGASGGGSVRAKHYCPNCIAESTHASDCPWWVTKGKKCNCGAIKLC